MRRLPLLSLASLFIVIGLLSSCQEEEAASPTTGGNPTTPVIDLPPIEPDGEYIAKSILVSDERTTNTLGQEGSLFFRVRPKGCPRGSLFLRPIGPRCMPSYDFLLAGLKGLQSDRFNFDKGFEGVIRDEKTGSVIAQLTDVIAGSDGKTFTLRYTATGEHKVTSNELQVNFTTLYTIDKSVIKANFEGTVTSEITEYLR